jgi:type VI secretion system secreted protein VgrG
MSNIIFGPPSFVVPPAGQIDAQATVTFRPNPRWKGEFMFDWMRTGSGTNLGQTSLDGDVDYQTILGYYNNNQAANTFVEDSTDTNNDGVKDLYGRLKGEYRIFTSLNRLDPAGRNIDYFEPKLCIYKHENETTKAVAILQLQIEVTVAPEELILEFENDFFEITLYTGTPPATPTLITTPAASTTPPVQPQERMKQLQISKTLTTGTFNTLEVQIECKKTFATGYKEITAYTVMANPDPAISQKIRKLAGTLKVLPNDASKRKVKKIVLINVKTDIDNDPINTVEEGFLVNDITETGQKNIIRKFLRQALIDPVFSVETLDLSSFGQPTTLIRDDFNRTYVDGGRLKCYYKYGATVPAHWKSLSDYLYTKLKAKPGVGTKYDNYMRIFYMPQSGFYIEPNNTPGPTGGVLGGYTDGTEPKNIVMVAGASPVSSSHEVYHSLKLPHTWESKNHIDPVFNSVTNPEINGKHSFKTKTTNNLMDYGERNKQYFLFHWQCIVANSHANAEPTHYTPAP